MKARALVCCICSRIGVTPNHPSIHVDPREPRVLTLYLELRRLAIRPQRKQFARCERISICEACLSKGGQNLWLILGRAVVTSISATWVAFLDADEGKAA